MKNVLVALCAISAAVLMTTNTASAKGGGGGTGISFIIGSLGQQDESTSASAFVATPVARPRTKTRHKR